MIVWMTILLIGGGMALALHGVLAVAGRESRFEEELAWQPSQSSRTAA